MDESHEPESQEVSKPLSAGHREVLFVLSKLSEIPSLWASIGVLRLLGCALPIRISVPETAPWAEAITGVLESMEDTLLEVEKSPAQGSEWGRLLRSVLHSTKEEVLVMSPHTMAVRNPAYLFENSDFQEAGVLLWPQFFVQVNRRLACQRLGIEHRPSVEVTDSQFLVSLAQHRDTLQTALELAEDDQLIELLWGNFADTLRFALHRHGRRIAGSNKLPEPLLLRDGGKGTLAALCFFDGAAEVVFQNRKWKPFRLQGSREIPGFFGDAFGRKCVARLLPIWVSRFLSTQLVAEPSLVGEWFLDEGSKIGFLAGATSVHLFENHLVGGLQKWRVEYWTAKPSETGLELCLLNAELEPVAELQVHPDGSAAGLWRSTRRACCLVSARIFQSDESMQRFQERHPGERRFLIPAEIPEEEPLHIVDLSLRLEDAVASLYFCCGLNLDRHILFHTPLSEWLYRFSHPRVFISSNANPKFANLSQPAAPGGFISFRMDSGERVRWAAEISAADEKCRRVFPGARARKPDLIERQVTQARLDFHQYVVIVPFSEERAREWPVAHWHRLIGLLRHAGLEVVAIGLEDYSERFTAELGESNAYWAKGEGMGEGAKGDGTEWSTDVLLSAQAVIAPNCGLAHIAAAHHVRTICLVSEFPEKYFAELPTVEIVSGDADCIHCWRKAAKGFTASCHTSCSALAAISPQAVFAQFAKEPSHLERLSPYE